LIRICMMLSIALALAALNRMIAAPFAA